MLSQAESGPARRDRKTRQHLMERSFARGTRYGLKQARWRRLWRVEIQEYLTATIQNVMVLIHCLKERWASAAKARARNINMSAGQQSARQQMPGQYSFNPLVRCALGLGW